MNPRLRSVLVTCVSEVCDPFLTNVANESVALVFEQSGGRAGGVGPHV